MKELGESLRPRRDEAEASAFASPSNPSVHSELAKILASETFRLAAGQREFLRYAVQETLAGRGAAIKEFCIATDVFRRGNEFDPRKDTIVRVEARKLRIRLAKYYETEGRGDPVVIELPKGTYTPVFKHWSDAAVSTNDTVEQIPPDLEAPPDGTLSPEPSENSSPNDAEAATHTFTAKPLVTRRTRLVKWLLPFMILLVLTGGTFFWWRRSHDSAGSRPMQASVLVLPFNDLNSDPQDEFFSNGLTDELIDALGRIPNLRVVARASAFQFKGKTVNLQEIGRRLRVRTVLEGSVRRFADRVRITVQLDDTTNGYRVWSNSYERELKDVLVVQREIAQAIVNALGVQLSGGTAQRVFAEARPVSPEAYQNYLRGLYYWNKGTVEAVNSAIGFFERAVAQEPDFGPAYVGLAHSYATLALETTTPTAELVPKIQSAANRALELDASLGGAHLDLAAPYSYEFNWSAAEREFRRALELNPGDAVGFVFYSGFLTRVGRLEEALETARQAVDLDPVSPLVVQAPAQPLYQMRRFAEAVKQYQASLALEPAYVRAHQGLGLTYLAMGEIPEGIRETEVAAKSSVSNATVTGQLGYAYARSGDKTRAHEILTSLLDRSKRESIRALPIAEIYIGLGDKDAAFEWLGKAIDQHEVSLFLKTDPVYDVLRSDPRFEGLLRRMNLL